MERLRLDQLLVARKLFATRSRARDAIQRGCVLSEGKPLEKPGLLVSSTIELVIDDPARTYVSRAALKLITALDYFALDVKDCSALDIGASTGGFTQVLLERGAKHVIAIDVGHGQLHPSLQQDNRIHLREGLNARDLQLNDLDGHKIDLVVSDVSFISLRLALPPALELAEPGAQAILLVKPQFELGAKFLGKGGILKNPSDGLDVAHQLEQWLNQQPGWCAKGLTPSTITGGDGNQEYLLLGEKRYD